MQTDIIATRQLSYIHEFYIFWNQCRCLSITAWLNLKKKKWKIT